MLQIIARNKLVFSVYIFFFLLGLVFIILEGKANSHLIINEWHSPFMDSFFKVVTFMGDGLFVTSAGLLILLFYSIRHGFAILTSLLVSSLLVQFLKKAIFSSFDRPMTFFNNLGTELYRIEGFEYHSNFSFPSGHSTSAFVLFIGLALISRKNSLKIIFLFLAILTAFSRTYLSQHFIIDIMAGSLIGTITILGIYFIFSRLDKQWLDRSLLMIKKSPDE